MVCEEVLKNLVVDHSATLLTTNWVKYEALTRLRGYGMTPCRRLQELLDKDLFSVEAVSQDLERRAVELFWTHTDKNWSVVDCSGFALMAERHILYAFAADRHFRQAGRFPLVEQDISGNWRKAYSYLNFG